MSLSRLRHYKRRTSMRARRRHSKQKQYMQRDGTRTRRGRRYGRGRSLIVCEGGKCEIGLRLACFKRSGCLRTHTRPHPYAETEAEARPAFPASHLWPSQHEASLACAPTRVRSSRLQRSPSRDRISHPGVLRWLGVSTIFSCQPSNRHWARCCLHCEHCEGTTGLAHASPSQQYRPI